MIENLQGKNLAKFWNLTATRPFVIAIQSLSTFLSAHCDVVKPLKLLPKHSIIKNFKFRYLKKDESFFKNSKIADLHFQGSFI